MLQCRGERRKSALGLVSSFRKKKKKGKKKNISPRIFREIVTRALESGQLLNTDPVSTPVHIFKEDSPVCETRKAYDIP